MECFRDVCCLRILVGREESIGTKYKGITIAQWDNRLQNGSFVNWTQLVSVILEALHPALPELAAGWLASRPSVYPADELAVSVWIF